MSARHYYGLRKACAGSARAGRRTCAVLAGLGWTLLATSAARGDDTELFVGSVASHGRPNILFILDDSASMGATVETQAGYDPAVPYPSAGCDAGAVYWSTSGAPPACDTNSFFDVDALVCQRALEAFAAPHGGTYTDTFAQYDAGTQSRWETIATTAKSGLVECADDRPDPATGWPGHGSRGDSGEVYARNGDPRHPWTADASEEIAWGSFPAGTTYTVYAGNYLNWYYGPATTSTRLDVMKEITTNVLNSVSGANVGLMRFNDEEGGRVIRVIDDVTTNRTELAQAIDSLTAGGFSPLEESLYEAYQYFRGGSVVFGADGVVGARAAGDPTRYESPIELGCQKNHIVLLTDGEPRLDQSAGDAIVRLTDAGGAGFAAITGAPVCDLETYPADFTSGDGGACLDDLAAFMKEGDLSPLPGQQQVTTHTVGFLADLPVLQETADRGGGRYYTASDAATLATALTSIVTSILDTSSSFTAPAVAVNSFNRTQNLDALYLGVFRPSGTTHWPGNLKKYRVRAPDGEIVDANGNPAVILDPATGARTFSPTARSLWSSGVDGNDIETGGAASRIPADRLVYTLLSGKELATAGNRISLSNRALTDELLNTGGPDDPTRDEIIAFINGLDASDTDQDGNLAEPRHQLGDPLHAEPAVVVYGPTNDDALVFAATNDGFLHAIDTVTGVERWAFIPPEFLGDQVALFRDNAAGAGSRHYGIDGNLRVLTVADGDGIIEPGEKVYLYFGMRRGGDGYYALDVSNPDAPRVMWHRNSDDLPGLGQSWSSVSPTRIEIANSNQNADRTVLVIGGGYDPSQDQAASTTDTIGNSIRFLDAETGALLWHGSNGGGDTTFDSSTTNASMDYSIPGDVRVIDLNGDGFADRMYAADMGGQLWRFDIVNGKPASGLVRGGVIARLGAAGVASPTLAETRRFYYAPDVAFVSNNDNSYLHIGTGSGYRAHPNETDNENRFYALRDYDTFGTKTSAEYRALIPVTDGDLIDVTAGPVTSVPIGAPGWKLLLNDGGWRGEKVLAESRTFNNRVYVTTFRPDPTGSGCAPGLGTARQYVMSVTDGAPVTNLDGSAKDAELALTDRYREWIGAPPPQTTFVFPENPDGPDGPPVQCVGVDCRPTDFDPNPKRTFWLEDVVE